MKIAIVCTQGGHLTETMQILDAFQEHDIFFVTHKSARDEDVKKIAPAYFSKSIEANIFRFLSSFPWALYILLKEKPDVIFSLGAEIALPFFFLAKIIRVKTIYLESWCRINDLSLTARISYPIVDIFLIQWPQLIEKCGPKAQYFGAVV